MRALSRRRLGLYITERGKFGEGEGGGGGGEGGGGVLLQTLQNFHRKRDLTLQEGRAWERGSEVEGENGRQGGLAGVWGSASKGGTGGGGEMHTLAVAHGESSIRALALLSRLVFSNVRLFVLMCSFCTRTLCRPGLHSLSSDFT